MCNKGYQPVAFVVFKIDKMSDQHKRHQKPSAGQRRNTLEINGRAKNKNPKILHRDGSLADLPGKEGSGSGALDGMAGRRM